jgi:hypothetical protein
MSNELITIEPEYVYVTIPAEYICVYHRILAMLADYGEDMLKDCKAACTDRNSSVIDCFNMFNSAVAARKLGKTKLAETLIKYIKAKINQIYRNKDNSTSFVFPLDENGEIAAFVSCGERPTFEINADDMNLYAHKFENGFDEHFKLSDYDFEDPVEESRLRVIFTPRYEEVEGVYRACCDLQVFYANKEIPPRVCDITYYYDDELVSSYLTKIAVEGDHNFTIVVSYKNDTKVLSKNLYYNENI